MTPLNDLDQLPPPMPLATVALLLGSVVAGVLAAVWLLPTWAPALSASLFGSPAKAYWYLSRASGLVAYGLLWLSMVFGLLMTNRFAQVWPGGPAAFDLHQHTSLLGLAFTLFHALILLGDRTVQLSPAAVLLPFASQGYRPLWVGLGQVGFWLLVPVALSFYLRRRLGTAAWRLLHFASFALFVLALLHGVRSGSDSGRPWTEALFWGSGGSVLFLTLVRVLSAHLLPARPARG